MEETKKKSIEDLAWEMYQNGIPIQWEAIKTPRENFHLHYNYDMYMKAVKQSLASGHIPSFEPRKLPKKEYSVIKVPANRHPDWFKGARTWLFIYSKEHGNFILEGYLGETEEYLKKNYTHYFYYRSLWHMGKSRGSWKFWKDGIGILPPDKKFKEWKYTIRPWGDCFLNMTADEVERKTLKFKRMPHRWIPEFNKL